MRNKSNYSKFLLLWAGDLISQIGGGLTSFGLGVYVFNQTNSAALMALITLCGFLPTIALSVPAGVLADMYDRRKLMMIGDGCSAIGMPSSIWYSFKYNAQFDQAYAENFYDCSWNNGHAHKDILEAIEIPCVYLHAKEGFGPNGEIICAASREQAERAISYIGDNCTMVETPTSDHTIHTKYTETYIDAVNSLKDK